MVDIFWIFDYADQYRFSRDNCITLGPRLLLYWLVEMRFALNFKRHLLHGLVTNPPCTKYDQPSAIASN